MATRILDLNRFGDPLLLNIKWKFVHQLRWSVKRIKTFVLANVFHNYASSVKKLRKTLQLFAIIGLDERKPFQFLFTNVRYYPWWAISLCSHYLVMVYGRCSLTERCSIRDLTRVVQCWISKQNKVFSSCTRGSIWVSKLSIKVRNSMRSPENFGNSGRGKNRPNLTELNESWDQSMRIWHWYFQRVGLIDIIVWDWNRT